MTKIMYGLWCEWDVGTTDLLFTTEEKAKKFAEEVWGQADIEETFEDVWGDFMGTMEYEVVE